VREDTDDPQEIADKKKKKKDDQKKESSGRLEYTFSAEGFGPPPKCDPKRKPKFKLEAGAHQKDDDENEDDSKSSTAKASGSMN